MKQWYFEVYSFLGLTGSSVILACMLIAALAYTGKEGEKYTIWRHFVSELGEFGVSRLAWLFNSGLIVGSFLLLIMIPGVGLSLNNVWGYIASIAGMIAAAGCLFVGVFPMNNIKPHTKAAMIYFRAGLATVILFGIAILVQPANARVIPLYSLIIAGLAMISYTSFLVLLGRSFKKNTNNALDTTSFHNRPAFWWMPLWEWMVVIFTILWFLIISIAR